MIKTMRRFALVALGFVFTFGLAAGSASAAPIPFFYLVPTGPGTVPTSVPTGSSTYQLWVDPSGVVASAPGAPGNCANIVGAPACTGIYGVTDLAILADGSLTMTAFSITYWTRSIFVSGTRLRILSAGDFINGNATPFDVGTLTVFNTGSGSGHLILVADNGAGYLDTQFNTGYVTLPQTLAVAAIPEPSTALLLSVGIVGLAARRRRARDASVG